MEGKARMTAEPGVDLGMLVSGVVIRDDLDDLADRYLGLDGVEETDELLMTMVLHVATDGGADEHVEGGEQGVVPSRPFFISNPGWVRSRAWIWLFSSSDSAMTWADGSTQSPTTSRSLATKSGSLESLNWRHRYGCNPCAFQMRRTALALMPQALAIMSAVQYVVSAGGSSSVRFATRSAMSGPRGGIREGRVLSRKRPLMPSSANRSCQRQTHVLDLPVWRIISTVTAPSALSRIMEARQTCFCGALRSATKAERRRRSDGETVNDIPVRMRPLKWESLAGLLC